MKRVGLIGHPDRAFAVAGDPERRLRLPWARGALRAVGHGGRRSWRRASAACATRDVLGANVTVPYKQAVMPYLDRLDALAEQTGAVNTIVNEDGRLAGYNTDVAGFEQALAAAGFSAEGQRVAVLGAGGAARAVGLVLVRAARRVD